MLWRTAVEVLLLSVHQRNPVNHFHNDTKLKNFFSFFYYTQHLYSNINKFS